MTQDTKYIRLSIDVLLTDVLPTQRCTLCMYVHMYTVSRKSSKVRLAI